jgi:hypothetical protein
MMFDDGIGESLKVCDVAPLSVDAYVPSTHRHQVIDRRFGENASRCPPDRVLVLVAPTPATAACHY